MWSLILKNRQVKLFAKQKQTHRLQKQTNQRGNMVGGEGYIKSLGLTYTLYYIESRSQYGPTG